MSSCTRLTRLPLACLSLLCALLLPLSVMTPQAQGIAPDSTAGPSAGSTAPASAGKPITTLQCRYFSEGGAADRYELCIQVLRQMSASYKKIFASYVEGGSGSGTTQGECLSKETKTFTYGGSVTVEAEGKAWIFAKVKAAVTASFSKSRTTEKSVKQGFKVKEGQTKYCYYAEKFARFKTKQCINNAYTDGRKCYKKTFSAPALEGWTVTTNPIPPWS